MARKTNFDRRLRSSVERDPKLGDEAGKVWDEVATAYKEWAPMERPYQVLERPAAQGSVLFAMRAPSSAEARRPPPSMTKRSKRCSSPSTWKTSRRWAKRKCPLRLCA